MAKTKKKMPGLNTTSTADISFMLLIFFLVTTSMDTDMGLARRLPKPPEPDQEDATMDIKSRNILYVRINAAGQLWIKDEMNSGYGELGELRARVKEFVKNEQNLSKLPEKHVKNTVGNGFAVDHGLQFMNSLGSSHVPSRVTMGLFFMNPWQRRRAGVHAVFASSGSAGCIAHTPARPSHMP